MNADEFDGMSVGFLRKLSEEDIERLVIESSDAEVRELNDVVYELRARAELFEGYCSSEIQRRDSL